MFYNIFVYNWSKYRLNKIKLQPFQIIFFVIYSIELQ